MPPADRIQTDQDSHVHTDPDHGHAATDSQPANDFLAIGPALRILQLNVEGLSSAKRTILGTLAQSQKADVICLQETHVDVDISSRFTILGYDLICHTLHSKHGRAIYVRSDIADVSQLSSVEFCDTIRVGNIYIANIYKPPNELWTEKNLPPHLPHPAVYVGDFNSHHVDWGYSDCDSNGELLVNWAAEKDLHLLFDPKQKGTFCSARWQQDYNPDLCWVSTSCGRPHPASYVVLSSFPHSQHRPSLIHAGLTLPVIHSVQKKRWNFRKANWREFTSETEKSIVTIPRRNIPIEEAYRRFTKAIFAAAKKTIPRGVRPLYVPCMPDEAAVLLEEYEQSGDPDIADHLIESLDSARKLRWQETVSKVNFSRSSRSGWALLRRLGAAQRPPKANKPPVSPNQVATHLINVAKAPKDKPFERTVRDSWRQYRRIKSSSAAPEPFSLAEIVLALQHVKTGTAPGYDNIHTEFLKNLGPLGQTWLAGFFTRIISESQIPKIWRQAKVIAVEKPGKDLNLASSYRPISLLSVCYKLLERIALHRIDAQVQQILSPDQAGFRRSRSTCDQVAALTTYIENGFQNRQKTGAVFLDLTAAYDTVWHVGLLFKLAKCLDHWFVHLVDLLLRNRRFRVHMGDQVSSWRLQKNGLPQGSVLAPTLFNLYTNDLPTTES